MSSADWTVLGNSLSTGILARAASSGFTVPNGGGTNVYAMNSFDGTVIGAAGLYTDLPNFNPTADGASVRCCIKRLSGAGTTGWSPFAFVLAGGTDVDDNAYIIGLEDRDPYRIVVVKGSMIAGVPEALAGAYLRRSSSEYQISEDLWHHVRLDALVQPGGDVYLQVFENDLLTNPCTAPVWQPITGMAQFIDDAAGINSGSLPYTSGYGGYAMAVQEAITRRSLFDHFQLIRQT